MGDIGAGRRLPPARPRSRGVIGGDGGRGRCAPRPQSGAAIPSPGSRAVAWKRCAPGGRPTDAAAQGGGDESLPPFPRRAAARRARGRPQTAWPPAAWLSGGHGRRPARGRERSQRATVSPCACGGRRGRGGVWSGAADARAHSPRHSLPSRRPLRPLCGRASRLPSPAARAVDQRRAAPDPQVRAAAGGRLPAARRAPGRRVHDAGSDAHPPLPQPWPTTPQPRTPPSKTSWPRAPCAGSLSGARAASAKRRRVARWLRSWRGAGATCC